MKLTILSKQVWILVIEVQKDYYYINKNYKRFYYVKSMSFNI